MNISEYFQYYRKEIDRIRTLYHEARRLGQDEGADEFIDELYALGSDHYQLMGKFRTTFQSMAVQQEDPKINKLLEEFEKQLGSSNEECAKILNRFVSDTLGLNVHSD